MPPKTSKGEDISFNPKNLYYCRHIDLNGQVYSAYLRSSQVTIGAVWQTMIWYRAIKSDEIATIGLSSINLYVYIALRY